MGARVCECTNSRFTEENAHLSESALGLSDSEPGLAYIQTSAVSASTLMFPWCGKGAFFWFRHRRSCISCCYRKGVSVTMSGREHQGLRKRTLGTRILGFWPQQASKANPRRADLGCMVSVHVYSFFTTPFSCSCSNATTETSIGIAFVIR